MSKSVRQRIAASVRGKPSAPRQPTEYKFGDIVLLGAAKVGKTAIADRFVNNYFTEKYDPTHAQRTFEVKALLEVEKANNKKKMILKKSFKKSVMGKSRPPLRSQQTMKKVLSVQSPGEAPSQGQANVSRAYQEAQEKGLKSLHFNLVDTPADMVEMEEMTYKATISNAKGFLLVCSFDIMDSLSFIEKRCEEIKNCRHGRETPIIIIANKHDLETNERVFEELDVNSLAAQLHVKYCTASVATEEGCNDMSELMLNEINLAAEQEEYLNSLPEDDYVYAAEEIDLGDY